jgi:hypothetical protein
VFLRVSPSRELSAIFDYTHVTLEGCIEMMRFVTVTWVTRRSDGKSHSFVNQSYRHMPSGTMGGGQLGLREPCKTWTWLF